jgi:hypothetical protein
MSDAADLGAPAVWDRPHAPERHRDSLSPLVPSSRSPYTCRRRHRGQSASRPGLVIWPDHVVRPEIGRQSRAQSGNCLRTPGHTHLVQILFLRTLRCVPSGCYGWLHSPNRRPTRPGLIRLDRPALHDGEHVRKSCSFRMGNRPASNKSSST